MGYSTWHEYGYGITDERFSMASSIDVENLRIAMAKYLPEYTLDICTRYEVNIDEIDVDVISDLEGEDGYSNGGLTYVIYKLLNAIALEKTGINGMFYSCDNYDGVGYLMVLPMYPWQMTDKWKNVNTHAIDEIIEETIDMIMLADAERPIVDYQDCENGG